MEYREKWSVNAAADYARKLPGESVVAMSLGARISGNRCEQKQRKWMPDLRQGAKDQLPRASNLVLSEKEHYGA